MSPDGHRRRPARRSLPRLGITRPGSHRDLRHSARIARWVVALDPIVAGLTYLLVPDLSRSGNLALVRELFDLRVWGAIWLLAGIASLTRLRAAGLSMLALTYILWALGTGATVLTGDLESPVGPVRALAMAAVLWWLRARAVARVAGDLPGDDLALRDDDEPGQRRRPRS